MDPIELEPPSGLIPVADERRRMDEPPPVRLVSIDDVRILDRQPTGLALISVDDAGENSITVVSGANEDVTAERAGRVVQRLGGPGAIVVLQGELPVDVLEETARAASAIGARVILRGLRTLSDMEYEFSMTMTNQRLDPSVETVFLMADGEYSHVSSGLIKQVAQFGGAASLDRFVPPQLIGPILSKMEGGAPA